MVNLNAMVHQDCSDECTETVFKPTECFTGDKVSPLGPDWITMYQSDCDFDAEGFFKVVHYLVRNPNITSSNLFRADILYDSDNTENVDIALPDVSQKQLKDQCPNLRHVLSQDNLKRHVVRRFVPRNDGLDKPINQSVYYYQDTSDIGSVVLMVPHVKAMAEIPFYHPKVAGLALTHRLSSAGGYVISISYCLFSEDVQHVLSNRQTRTALHSLKTIWKHGQGNLTGYNKRVHHDQILPQKRVQDRFADLKRKYSARLIDNWAEVTDPAKQVFEQIGIAAFLLELWDDMYAPSNGLQSEKPDFPGFVDIGCGNGVLLEILLSEGRSGWGLEGHRRKTWLTLSSKSQSAIVHGLFVPAPLECIAEPDGLGLDFRVSKNPKPDGMDNSASITKKIKSLSVRLFNKDNKSEKSESDLPPFHNGIFNTSPETNEGPFIISNHADELTGWTPFLALLNRSSFFIVPCCSRNLSGERFRAPSHGNNWTADNAAPTYFSGRKAQKSNNQSKKHIAIHVPLSSNHENPEEHKDSLQSETSSISSLHSSKTDREHKYHFINAAPLEILPSTTNNHRNTPSITKKQAAEQGDLKTLSAKSRSKTLSGYQALCCWVVHLADQCGYLVEREMLRLPSTRNYGIVCRFQKGDFVFDGDGDCGEEPVVKPTANLQERMVKALEVVVAEGGADRSTWVGVCAKEVVKGNDWVGHEL